MENYNEHKIYDATNFSSRKECYYLNGKLHRIDGPAYIEYNTDGTILFERYYTNGLYHRLSGPVIIRYYTDGSINYESYYLFGWHISKEQFNTPGFVDAFILEHS